MASREMKTMLTQSFGVTNKEHYGMLCYFWSNQLRTNEIRVQKHDNDNSVATSGQAYPQRFHNEFEKKKPDWLRKWHDNFQPITKRSNKNLRNSPVKLGIVVFSRNLPSKVLTVLECKITLLAKAKETNPV